VFIGKWINEGNTVATSEAPEAKIVTSDVYEWIPGRFAVLHTAYGHIGDLDVGGVEIIGCDSQRGQYTSHFFDSQGHVIVDELIYAAGKWIWTGERIRTTAEFSDDGKIQRALHEQLEDGGEWRLAMDMTLKKIAEGSHHPNGIRRVVCLDPSVQASSHIRLFRCHRGRRRSSRRASRRGRRW
jgi:hypothetical protein